MAKQPTLEQTLDALSAVQRDPSAPDATDRLRASLQSRWNVAVAKAAAIISDRRLDRHRPDLVATFDRLIEAPAKRDAQCVGMIAVVRALLELQAATPTVFLAGLRHRQFDGAPEHGRPTDSAGPLRGYCGLGLLAMRHPEAHVELVNLLADPEVPARVAGAQGLSAVGGEGAAWVLRLKLLTGAAEGEAGDVLGECMAGLLRLDPERSLSLVASFLENDRAGTAAAAAAAFALAECRHAAAVSILTAAADRAEDDEAKRTLLLALGASRSTEALEYLLAALPSAPPPAAAAALEAAAMFGRDPGVRERVARIVDARADPSLRRTFAVVFADSRP